jgi:hypothetical protein
MLGRLFKRLFKTEAKKEAELGESDAKIRYLVERLQEMYSKLTEAHTSTKRIREKLIKTQGSANRLLYVNFKEQDPMKYIDDFLRELKLYEDARDGLLQSVKEKACPERDEKQKVLYEIFKNFDSIQKEGPTEFQRSEIIKLMSAIDEFIECYQIVGEILFEHLLYSIGSKMPHRLAYMRDGTIWNERI